MGRRASRRRRGVATQAQPGVTAVARSLTHAGDARSIRTVLRSDAFFSDRRPITALIARAASEGHQSGDEKAKKPSERTTPSVNHPMPFLSLTARAQARAQPFQVTGFAIEQYRESTSN